MVLLKSQYIDPYEGNHSNWIHDLSISSEPVTQGTSTGRGLGRKLDKKGHQCVRGGWWAWSWTWAASRSLGQLPGLQASATGLDDSSEGWQLAGHEGQRPAAKSEMACSFVSAILQPVIPAEVQCIGFLSLASGSTLRPFLMKLPKSSISSHHPLRPLPWRETRLDFKDAGPMFQQNSYPNPRAWALLELPGGRPWGTTDCGRNDPWGCGTWTGAVGVSVRVVEAYEMDELLKKASPDENLCRICMWIHPPKQNLKRNCEAYKGESQLYRRTER